MKRILLAALFLIAGPLEAATQSQVLTSVSATSFCNLITSPAVAAADTVVIDTTTTPSAFPVTIQNTCDLSFPSNGSRQSVQYTIHDASVGADMVGSPGTLWFNNQAPQGPTDVLVFVFPVNVAISPTVDLRGYWMDAEGDTLTCTALDAPPTGITVSSSALTGTPTAGGIFANKRLSCADPIGDSDTGLATYLIGNLTIPTVTNETLSQAIVDMQAAYFNFSMSSAHSDTVPVGSVISESPTGTAVPYATVNLVISTGAVGLPSNRTPHLSLGLGLPLH